MEHLFSVEHVAIWFSGVSMIGIVAHAVNTFPVPQNPYARWALSVVQFIVGQRLQAAQTKLADTQQMKAANGQ